MILDFSNILTATYINDKNNKNYLLACKDVSAQLDFSECALANRLAYNVMPDTLGLLLFLVAPCTACSMFLGGCMFMILRLLLLHWQKDIECIFDIERR